jgi:hypothetical protein
MAPVEVKSVLDEVGGHVRFLSSVLTVEDSQPRVEAGV